MRRHNPRALTVTEAYWFIFSLATSGIGVLTVTGATALLAVGERDTALAASAAASGLWLAGLIICGIQAMTAGNQDDIEPVERHARPIEHRPNGRPIEHDTSPTQ